MIPFPYEVTLPSCTTVLLRNYSVNNLIHAQCIGTDRTRIIVSYKFGLEIVLTAYTLSSLNYLTYTYTVG